MTPRQAGRLSLTRWVGCFAVLVLLLGAGTTALLLRLHRSVSLTEVEFGVVGLVAGLSVALIPVLAAARLAAGLRHLHAAALVRLADPGAELLDRPLSTRATGEVAALAQLLAALQLRIRVGDEASERHRRAAETAGLGVFKLLSGLVTAEEGARGQLAAELHDTVAQSLMLARGLLGVPPGTPVDLVALAGHVEDAEEHVRAVMARTRPPALREGDLAGAVGDLRVDMLARYGLRVAIDWPVAAHPLPLASAITVYRFFQEALLNVVKHADVDDATLTLTVTADGVVATVRDAGPGFHPLHVRPRGGRHVGLGLLRERARLSGGALEIMSMPGEGATLTLTLPRAPGVPPNTLLPLTRTSGATLPLTQLPATMLPITQLPATQLPATHTPVTPVTPVPAPVPGPRRGTAPAHAGG